MRKTWHRLQKLTAEQSPRHRLVTTTQGSNYMTAGAQRKEPTQPDGFLEKVT